MPSRASLDPPSTVGGVSAFRLATAGAAGAGAGRGGGGGASSLQPAATNIAEATRKRVVRFMVLSLCCKGSSSALDTFSVVRQGVILRLPSSRGIRRNRSGCCHDTSIRFVRRQRGSEGQLSPRRRAPAQPCDRLSACC